MSRAGLVAGALSVVATLSPAAAQSWSVGVGVGFGGPAYYGPPPVYYAAPPVYRYEQPPPVVYMPAPEPEVRSSLPPDAIFTALDRAGYTDLSPMAFRDGVYKLNAVNRRGDLVALEVSALDGRVEREFILTAGRRAPAAQPQVRRPVAASPPPVSSPPHAPGGDPLVVY